MNGFLVFVYFSCFAVIAGAAFAMMWGNMMSINKKSMGGEPKRHPEAPADGEEIMYVDLTRERLEGHYKDEEPDI